MNFFIISSYFIHQFFSNPTNCDNDGDTSGIGSMTSATHSGTSAPGTAEQRERQRAAVFRKARLSAGSGATSAAAGTGGGCSQQQSAIPRQQQQQPKRPPDQQQFDSLMWVLNSKLKRIWVFRHTYL
jgi:hypothetical protein